MRNIPTRIVVVALIAFIFLAVWSNTAKEVEPGLSKVPYNESEGQPNFVGPHEKLRANFSGHFYVVVTRSFGRIRLWITPKEGTETLHIGIKVKRKFLNGLYLEVEPPWYGKVEISREDSSNGMVYSIQVRELGEAGKGTYGITFIDMAPEDKIAMDIEVEVRDGLTKYRGELPVVILDPSYQAREESNGSKSIKGLNTQEFVGDR
ncbi:hypothetical protein [Thermococcus sp.]